jgi:hypothetical protein
MANNKQEQYIQYLAGGGKLSLPDWELEGRFDSLGNSLLSSELQIGNFVLLVYDTNLPRRVQEIYDQAVFLEGRVEPDDERDLVPLIISPESIAALGLAEDYETFQSFIQDLTLPYVHLLQQFIHLLNQSKIHASDNNISLK